MKALVIGAARSGIAISKLLVKHNYEVYLTDKSEVHNKAKLKQLNINVYDKGHPDLLKDIDYDLIVKNPGIPYHNEFIQHFVTKGYFIYNEIEIAQSYASNYHIAAITGTNGKTTTTALLEHILKQSTISATSAGNIGLPLSEVYELYGNQELNVALEIAAFQLLGTKEFRPNISTCTNLSPDHLDYFDSLDAYYQAKMLVYKNQRDDDWFIRNIDDINIVKYAKDIKCRIIDFSMKVKADLYLENDKIYLFDEVLFEKSDLHLVGKHNLANAMMAACMAYKLGISVELIKKGIQTFKGVEHRIEFVGEFKSNKLYNDSKSTTVESTIVALEAFNKPVILLAGGYDKKTGFNALSKYTSNIKYLIAYGETKYQIKEVYPNTIILDNLKEALDYALTLANDDIIILSPMCASYDQFLNYEKRGEYFKDLVREYINKGVK